MANKAKSVLKVTKSIDKKGRLKGSNKKETKVLKGLCPHHRINKNGKVKPTIFSNDGEYCICTMCGAKFPAKFFTNDEIKTLVNDMKEMNNQNKYTAVATNSGDNMVDFFSQFGVMLQSYKKNTKKLRNVAEKQGNVRNKKKNKNGGGNGSSMYGSWGQK